MAETVDARGLSCPEPIIMTLQEIKSGRSTEIVVLVDTDTSKENVTRAASSYGWRTKAISQDGEGYRILITKD
jgi:TusA-related sulfurtransferase